MTGGSAARRYALTTASDVRPRSAIREALTGELARLAAAYRLSRQAIGHWQESMWAPDERLRVADTRRLLDARDRLFDRQRQIRIQLANLGRNDIWEEIDGRTGFSTPDV